MTPIPSDWLAGKPKRIIIHWTAGSHSPSTDDFQHYHLIIDGLGKWHRGRHSIADNDSTSDGTYAAHTRGANTRAIGIALCGMSGSKERPFTPGPFPLRPVQWAALYAGCAQIVRNYPITVTRTTLLTHAEVQPTLGIPQRGKWDITVHPETGNLTDPLTVGDYIRDRVMGLL
jgi:hypothetical protein